MLPDTAAQNPDKPWARRLRATPLLTWSGRVVYEKKKRPWTTRDLERVFRAVAPPPDAAPDTWATVVIKLLRGLSLQMLGTILFFLPPDAIAELYQWCIEILDKLFSGNQNTENNTRNGRGLILYISNRQGIPLEFK